MAVIGNVHQAWLGEASDRPDLNYWIQSEATSAANFHDEPISSSYNKVVGNRRPGNQSGSAPLSLLKL